MRAFGVIEFTQLAELTKSGKAEKTYSLTSKRYTEDERSLMEQETFCGVTNIYWPLKDKRFKLVQKGE